MLENDKLYQRLQIIRPRVGMYLSEITINNLGSFIHGYTSALHDFASKDGNWWQDFQSFAAKKYGYGSSTAGVFNVCLAHILGYTAENVSWEEVISYHFSQEEEQKAIALFYTLLDEFSLRK